MANIMMTDVCNLHCPYCFANEFVNKDKNEITEENFLKAVDFILGDGSRNNVGLIGGEPTVHSDFQGLLRKLIADERAEHITLYTNGIKIDEYWDIVCHKKVHMLINCNAPDDIGEKNFQRLCRNLDYLFDTRLFGDNVNLGINMYQTDFEYEYLLNLLKKYNLHRVRVSITVPNLESGRNTDAHEYFLKMKPRMFQFFEDLLSNDIIPNFDCNKIPSCLITEEDLKRFQGYLSREYVREHYRYSNISNTIVECRPVIDIRQDLTAVRCFGLSEFTKQDIRNFKGIQDLTNFYMRTVDAYAYNCVYSEKCVDCYDRKVLRCTGGCLAFKINRILSAQRKVDEMLHKAEC